MSFIYIYDKKTGKKYRQTVTSLDSLYIPILDISSTSGSESSGGSDLPVSDFNPASVSNLILWFEADNLSGLVEAESVSTWPNLGSLSESVTLNQESSSRQPSYNTDGMNGYPGVQFDGVDDYMKTDVTFNHVNGYTMYVVFKPLSTNPIGTTETIAVATRGGATNVITLNSSNQKISVGDATTTTSSAEFTNDVYIVTIHQNRSPDLWQIFINDVQVGESAQNYHMLGATVWLGIRDNILGPSNCLIGAVYFYSGFLNQTQRDSVYAHLSTKYSVV